MQELTSGIVMYKYLHIINMRFYKIHCLIVCHDRRNYDWINLVNYSISELAGCR